MEQEKGHNDGEYWEWSGPATPFNLHLSLHYYDGTEIPPMESIAI
jgi:hypothetical protein